MGRVVITHVGVAIWHEALPADGPSLGRPAAGVIRLDRGSAILRKADKHKGAHVSRGEAYCLLVVDQDVVSSLELVADGGIAAALKLQESRAMMFMPSRDIRVSCCIESLALACHARIVGRNCKQTRDALTNLQACVQCIKGGSVEFRLLCRETAIQGCGCVAGSVVVERGKGNARACEGRTREVW